MGNSPTYGVQFADLPTEAVVSSPQRAMNGQRTSGSGAAGRAPYSATAQRYNSGAAGLHTPGHGAPRVARSVTTDGGGRRQQQRPRRTLDVNTNMPIMQPVFEFSPQSQPQLASPPPYAAILPTGATTTSSVTSPLLSTSSVSSATQPAASAPTTAAGTAAPAPVATARAPTNTASAAAYQVSSSATVHGDTGTEIMTGNFLLLHGDPPTHLLCNPSAATDECAVTSSEFGVWRSVFQVVACVDSIPDRMFTPKNDSVERVDPNLQQLSQWPRLVALQLERSHVETLHEADIDRALVNCMQQTDAICSMRVAFEPNKFRRSSGEDVSPGYLRTASRIPPGDEITFDICTDYALYRAEHWYNDPKAQRKAMWSPPFLDEGGSNVPMITYTVPVRSQGIIVGVVAMNVQLDSKSDVVVPGASSDGPMSSKSSKSGGVSVDDLAAGAQQLANALSSLSQADFKDENFDPLMQSLINSNPAIFGSCIAFVENAFCAGKQDHTLYICRNLAAPGTLNDRISLPFNYHGEAWFEPAVREFRDNWSDPYFDEGAGNIWMVTYTVPFVREGKVAGVVTIDVQYDDSFQEQLSHRTSEAQAAVVCVMCGNGCKDSHFDIVGSLLKASVCNRCHLAGLQPADTEGATMRHVISAEYKEWVDKNRRPNIPVRYGQCIQLYHVASQSFLSVGIPNADHHAAYVEDKATETAAKMGADDMHELASSSESRSRTSSVDSFGLLDAADDARSVESEALGQDASKSSKPSLSRLYHVQLEQTPTDPLLEGTGDSWFRVVSASGSHAFGEVVSWGDDIELVSVRWGWRITLPLTAQSGTVANITSITTIASFRPGLYSHQLPVSLLTFMNDTAAVTGDESRRLDNFTNVSTPAADSMDGDQLDANALYGGASIVIMALRGRAARGAGCSAMCADVALPIENVTVGRDAVFMRGDMTATDTGSNSSASSPDDEQIPQTHSSSIWTVVLDPAIGRPHGAPVRWCDPFCLYHRASGQYLALPPRKRRGQSSIAVPCVTVLRLVEAARFRAVPMTSISSEEDPIDFDAYFKLVGDGKWWLGLADTDVPAGSSASVLPPDAANAAAAQQMWLWTARSRALDLAMTPVPATRAVAADTVIGSVKDLVQFANDVYVLLHNKAGDDSTKSRTSKAPARPEAPDKPQRTPVKARPPLDLNPPASAPVPTGPVVIQESARKQWRLLIAGWRSKRARKYGIQGVPWDEAVRIYFGRGRNRSPLLWRDVCDAVQRRLGVTRRCVTRLLRFLSQEFTGSDSTTSQLDFVEDYAGAATERVRQALFRECRGIEAAFGTLHSVLSIFKRLSSFRLDDVRGIAQECIAVSIACLDLIHRAVMLNQRSSVAASAYFDTLLNLTTNTRAQSVTSPSLEVGRRASAVMQEILVRNRSLSSELTMETLQDIINAFFSSQHVPVRILNLLATIAARPVARTSMFLDGALVPIPRNQYCIIANLFLAHNCIVIRKFLHPSAPYWAEINKARGEEAAVIVPQAADPADAGTPLPSDMKTRSMVALLNLITVLSVGPMGMVLRDALETHGEVSFERLSALACSEKVKPSDTPSAFPLRSRIMDLMRALYLEPQLISPVDEGTRMLLSFARISHETCAGAGVVERDVADGMLSQAKWTRVSYDVGDSDFPASSYEDHAAASSGDESDASDGAVGYLADLATASAVRVESDCVMSETRQVMKSRAQSLLAFVCEYFSSCASFSKKNVLTLAVLRTVHVLVASGLSSVLTDEQSHKLVTQLVSLLGITQRKDVSATSPDDHYQQHHLYLLHTKRRAALVLHMLMDQAIRRRALSLIQFVVPEKCRKVDVRLFPTADLRSPTGFTRSRTASRRSSLLVAPNAGTSAAPSAELTMEQLVAEAQADMLIKACDEAGLDKLLYGLFADCTWAPLLRHAASLLVRRNAILSETITAMRGMCVLFTDKEHEYACVVHLLLRRLKAVTCLERTASHASELNVQRAAEIVGVSRYLVRLLTEHLRACRSSCVSISQAQAIYQALGVHEVLMQLVRMPLSGAVTAFSLMNAQVNLATLFSIEPADGTRTRSTSHIGSYAPDVATPSHPLLPMLRDCYVLLTRLTRRNERLCKSLSRHTNFFLSQCGMGLHVSQLLHELVRGDPKACEVVSQPHLRRILLRLHDPAPERRLNRLQLLRDLVAHADGKLVTANQMVVMRWICESRATLRLLADGDDASVRKLSCLFDAYRGRCPPATSEARYYMRLLHLLAICSPNSVVYRHGQPAREHEEAAMLGRAAIPLRGLVRVLGSVWCPEAKICLLRYLEQVYGIGLLVAFGQGKLGADPPINYILVDTAHCVQLFGQLCGFSNGEAPNFSARPFQTFVPTQDVPVLSMASYLFNAVLPFLTTYFHSHYRQVSAAKSTTAAAEQLFEALFKLGTDLVHCHSALVAVRWSWIDSVLNCILNMHDGEGTLRCTGVRANRSDTEVQVLVDGLRVRRTVIKWRRCLQTASRTPGGEGNAMDPRALLQTPGDTTTASAYRSGWDKLRDALPKFVAALHSTTDPLQMVTEGARYIEDALNQYEQLSSEAVTEKFEGLCTLFISHIAPGADASDSDHKSADQALATLVQLLSGLADRQFEGLDSGSALCRDPAAMCTSLLVSFMKVLAKLADTDSESAKEAQQRRLVELGVPTMLVRLVDRARAYREAGFAIDGQNPIMQQVLLVGNAMLDEGYVPAQSSLYRELKGGGNVFLAEVRDLLRNTNLIILPRQLHDGEAASDTRVVPRISSLPTDVMNNDQAMIQQQQWADVDHVLSLLQQLCEGHRREWQDLLREQPGEAVKVDVVSEIAQLLGRLACGVGPVWYIINYWDDRYEPLTIVRVINCLTQLFATLTEVMQGPCVGNQALLSGGRLLDAINWLWGSIESAFSKEKNPSSKCGSWTPLIGDGFIDEVDEDVRELMRMPRRAILLRLQHRILDTLCAVLEGNGSALAAQRLVQRLDVRKIEKLLTIILPEAEAARDQPLGLEDLDPEVEGQRLSEGVWTGPRATMDLAIMYLIFIRQLAVNLGVSAKFERKSASAAVPQSMLSLVNCHVVQKLHKEFNAYVGSVEVLRDGELSTMVFRIPDSVMDHRTQAEFLEARRAVLFDVPRDNPYSKINSFAQDSGVLLELLMADPRLQQGWFAKNEHHFSSWTLVLAVMLNFFLLCHSSEWLPNMSTMAHDFISWMLLILGVLHSIASAVRLFGFFVVKLAVTKPSSWLAAAQCVGTLAQSKMGFYLISYTLLSIIAVVTESPALYAFHLFDLVLRSALIRQTFKALQEHGGSLGATAVLYLLLMYCFALVGHAFFAEDFPDTQCTTIASCVAFTMNFGMRAGGGLGDVLEGMGTYSGAGRMAFDMLFFVLIPVVMLSIVSGIIIDAFGASRDQRSEVDNDQKQNCFICSLEGSRFDRAGCTFEYHYTYEHNLWHYLYLQAYLKLKDENSYTGLESFIADRIELKAVDYFPIHKSTSAGDADEHDE